MHQMYQHCAIHVPCGYHAKASSFRHHNSKYMSMKLALFHTYEQAPETLNLMVADWPYEMLRLVNLTMVLLFSQMAV